MQDLFSQPQSHHGENVDLSILQGALSEVHFYFLIFIIMLVSQKFKKNHCKH
jgi:hypothetical protein